MKTRIIVTMCLCVLCQGCIESVKEGSLRMAFPEEEYTKLQKTGDCTVFGQVFLTTIGGNTKYSGGMPVWLFPKTSYSDEWYEQYYLKGNKGYFGDDHRVYEYTPQTKVDGEGYFELGNVPEGDYYIVSMVVWFTPTGCFNALEKQGGTIAELIHIKNGKNKIILTR